MLEWAEGFFPADLVLPSACIRFVWRKLARRECVGVSGWIFSDGVNFTVRLHPVCLQPAREECVGADGMDFSSGVNFIVRLPPVCLCKSARGNALGWRIDFFRWI